MLRGFSKISKGVSISKGRLVYISAGWVVSISSGCGVLFDGVGSERNKALGPILGDFKILSGSNGKIPAALKLCVAFDRVVAADHTFSKTLPKLSKLTPSPVLKI